jgi:hypothetical protein
MVRIVKTVKDYGSTTISTSSTTKETQTIKALGDILSWGIHTDLTTVIGTGTADANGGTPTGSWLGTNIFKLFRRVTVRDNANTIVFEAQGTDFHHFAYLLSITDPNEFLFDRGLQESPTIDSGSVTNQEEEIIFPESILLKDLPATIEVELGTLDEYYNAVGTGTAVINVLTVWVRYAPPQASGFTVRIQAFNVTSFSADQDEAFLLPEAITFLQLAYLPANPNASSAPAEMVNTNVDRLSLRRGSNEEIEEQLRVILDDWVDQVYTGDRSTGLTVLPTDAFVKTASTLFKFFVNSTIIPRIYYVYK